MMNYILGVDIAKDKLDCCLLGAGEPLFFECPNGPGGFRALARWLKAAQVPWADLRACMEATGRYGEKLLHWLFKQGAAASEVNAAQVKYFARSRLARNKTDRADARLIAEFCRAQAPRLWNPPAPEIARLQGLTRLLTSRKNQLASERRRAAMLPAFLRPHTSPLARAFKRAIAKLQAEIDALIAAHPELKARRDLLCSIPCVGKATAQVVLAELPPQIQSARQAAAYAGLTPRREQSGKKEGRARLSKTGNTHLRHALYMPGLTGRRSNPRLQELAGRLQEKGKAPKQAIGACMHLLLRICFGVLASGQPFQADWKGRQRGLQKVA
jgi:transposase